MGADGFNNSRSYRGSEYGDDDDVQFNRMGDDDQDFEATS